MIELPKCCNLELTNACNLRCVMCANKTMKRPIGYMGLPLVQLVLEQVKQAEIPLVQLNTIGEPLLHPKLFDIIALCKAHGLEVVLNTNFQLATESIIQRLLHSGLDILYISIEGTLKEAYEEIRVDASYEKIRNDLRKLNQIASTLAKRPRIVIRSVIQPGNDSEESMIAHWQEFCDEIKFIRMNNQGGYLRLPKDKQIWSGAPRRPCKLPWGYVSITWDGFLSYCCVDFEAEMKMGNVMDNTILDIWNSKDYAELRNKHRTGDFKGLSHCGQCATTFEGWQV